MTTHLSDCSLHNGPETLPKPCDCGADPSMTPEKYGSEYPHTYSILDDEETQALFKAYYAAGNALRKRRDELIPPGSHIMSQIDYGTYTEALKGNARPHEINADGRVIVWSNLEIERTTTQIKNEQSPKQEG